MLSLLAIIVSLCGVIYSAILLILSVAKYIPYWVVNYTSIMATVHEYVPVGLSVVALVCSGTMLFRFVYNAVRGSGA